MREPKLSPTRRYFLAAPTRQQAKNIYWQDIKDLTRERWFKTPMESELIVYVRGAKGFTSAEIHVVGMDKPQRIEGQPWDGGILDEYGNMKPEAWTENVRPALADRVGWCWLIGVPEGRNHYYDVALDACGGALPDVVPGEGAYAITDDFGYFTWFSSDILPPAEIEAARKHLDAKTFRQEFEGSFESFEGLAYWSFGKHNLKMIDFDKNAVVAVGMDFNVDPMTAVLGHIRGDEYHQFGEAWLPNSNTYEMCEHLKERFDQRQIVVYPDSTGKARESNATESDIAILKRAGFTVRARSTNPLIKDRVNAVNSHMQSSDGTARYFIDPVNCTKTLNDLNKRERLADGRLNKEQEKTGLGHISDALGYLIAYNWPVKQRLIREVKRG